MRGGKAYFFNADTFFVLRCCPALLCSGAHKPSLAAPISIPKAALMTPRCQA
jgi:hypothetical protein